MATATKAEEIKALKSMALALAGAIRDLGEVPSGHLYARVMGSGIDLALYQNLIGILKNMGWVSESGHLLKWVGPAKAA